MAKLRIAQNNAGRTILKHSDCEGLALRYYYRKSLDYWAYLFLSLLDDIYR